jgi:hypothetical protein
MNNRFYPNEALGKLGSDKCKVDLTLIKIMKFADSNNHMISFYKNIKRIKIVYVNMRL